MRNSNSLKKKSVISAVLFITLLLISVILYLDFFVFNNNVSSEYKEILTVQEREWLRKSPTITITPDPKFQPIEFFNENNEYEGITADYFKLIERKLNYKFKLLKFKTWEEVIENAKARNVDVITAAQKTVARSEYLDFTESMFDIPNMIIARNDVPDNITVNDLFQKKVAITKGYAIDEYIRTNFPMVEVEETISDEEAMQKVSFGKCYAAIINVAIASTEIQAHGITNLKVAGNTDLSSPLCIASRNDLPIINSILSKALKSISKEEKDAIYTKWIKIDFHSTTFYSENWPYIIAGLIAIFGMIVVILFWNWTLKQKVALKTKELENELNEKRIIEESLLQKETLLNFALNSNGSSLFENNFATGDCYISPAIFISLGYSEEQIPTRMDDLNKFIHPDDFRQTMDAFQRHVDNDAIPYYAEFRMRNSEGDWVWTSGAGRIFERDAEGGAIRLLGLSTIIDDRKRNEDEIKKINSELEDRVIERTEQLNNAMLNLRNEIEERIKTEQELTVAKDNLSKALEVEKELNELKSRFVAMVSHEYRTPLTVILSSTYLIEKYFEYGDKAGFQKYLLRIQNTVELMTELLEKVLFLGRTDSKNAIINRSEFNLIECIQASIDDLISEDKTTHEIITYFENEEIIVNSDERMLSNILSNLISNALKYSPKGYAVEIYCGVRNNSPYFEVKDKGIGIPQNEISNLFIPFHRFSNVGAIEGSGLGLAIVKRCADLINADITVMSKVNSGTTFVVTLPSNE